MSNSQTKLVSSKLQERRGLLREHRIWRMMLARCYREANPNYRWYGALGTYVCNRWRESARAFIEDMGAAPSKGHTLDRINTYGSYTCGKCDECHNLGQPANCRWATKHEQVRNAKNNLWYEYKGKRLILKDWAREVGIKYLTLYQRLKTGWTFEEAITHKVREIHAWPNTYECDGVRLTLRQWATKSGVPYKALRHRIARGWSFKDAITRPVRKVNR